MEQLNWHVSRELARYGEVRVIGPAGSAALAPGGVTVTESRSTRMAAYLCDAFFKCLRLARAWRPDIILAGSGLTAPIAVIAARWVGARSAVYTHGLDLAIDHAIYRQVWLPFIARADTVVVNSNATHRLAQAAGVREEKIRLVHPGVEIADDPADRESRPGAEFRRKHGIGDEKKILLSVGRLTHRKGMLEFVRDVLPAVVASCPECLLVVVGDAPTHALAAAGQSIQSIEAAARQAGVGDHVRFVGVISDRRELSCAYRSASLHVFPVRERLNDPEGFGMVAIEAAAHGVATVAYRTGGVPDAVRDNESGRLVECGDSAGFASAVISLLENPLPVAAVQAFASRFAWDRIGRELAEALALLPLR